jgi:hypothetical protein
MLPRMPRPTVTLLALSLAFLATPGPARAATIEITAAQTHLTLDTPGAKACVVLPVESRAGSACDGFDVEASAELLGKSDEHISGFAKITFPDWSLVVILKSNPGTTVHTDDEIRGFIRGLKESGSGVGLANDAVRVHGDARDTQFTLDQVNGVDSLRIQVDYDVPADSPMRGGSRTLLYVLDGDATSLMVMFSTDPEHAAQARPIAESIMRTLVMPPSRAGSYGQSRAFVIGRSLGRLLMPVLALLIIVLVKKWQSRKKAAPQG